MRMSLPPRLIAAFLATLLAGCNDSSAPSTQTAPAPTAASARTPSPATNAPAAPAAPAAPTATREVVAAVKSEAADVFANLAQQLAAIAKNDGTLKDISFDFQKSAQHLGASLKGNETVTSQLNGAVQSLLGNKDVDALKGFDQLSAAKLTPEQTTLVKELYNVGAAYVTQKNFASLEGAQTEVSQLVGALRKGELSSTLPPLQKIYQNAKLTPAQKDLVGSLADKYAPGLKSAAGKLSGSLDQLKKFGQ